MITIVIPAFNEEGAISSTIKNLKSTLSKSEFKKYEILVVDDASKDKTKEIAFAAGAKVITKIQNLGYGHSLKIGISAAKFDTIIITDADGTYPIHEIPRLIKLYLTGFDLVIGSRTGKVYKESFIKHPMRLILKFLVEFAAGREIKDPNSGLRVFSKKEIMPLFPTLCDRFSFTTSMTLAFMMLQKSVEFIDVDYAERVGKSKVRLLKDSLLTLQYIIQAINYYNPIKIFLVLSFFTASIGLSFLLLGIFLTIKTFILLGIASFVASILVLGLGLLADLLKQILVSSAINSKK
jgi:glycosyltransferase involved in cell wall biosynthesis